MLLGVAVLAVLFGAPVVWMLSRVCDPPALPAPERERAAIARHAQARAEIGRIERESRQLMRTVAAEPIMAAATPVVATPWVSAQVALAAIVDGFVWAPSPFTSNSTAGGQVTYVMPLRGRR